MGGERAPRSEPSCGDEAHQPQRQQDRRPEPELADEGRQTAYQEGTTSGIILRWLRLRLTAVDGLETPRGMAAGIASKPTTQWAMLAFRLSKVLRIGSATLPRPMRWATDLAKMSTLSVKVRLR